MLERLISIAAPHQCVSCGTEGTLLCSQCRLELVPYPARCYRCHRLTSQYQTCRNCKRKTEIKHLWIAASYENTAKELIHKLKFERANAASRDIVEILDKLIPLLPEETVVTHVPTVPSRVRQRGYDQAALIAKQFAYKRRLLYMPTLLRVKSTRQVGSTRKDRFEQLEGVFEVRNAKKVANQRILLIDDVFTTGATLETAARALEAAGAQYIDAAVFAH